MTFPARPASLPARQPHLNINKVNIRNLKKKWSEAWGYWAMTTL